MALERRAWVRVECPTCGEAYMLEVHGHRQCAACGRVLEDCCEQEQAQPAPERFTVFVEE